MYRCLHAVIAAFLPPIQRVTGEAGHCDAERGGCRKHQPGSTADKQALKTTGDYLDYRSVSPILAPPVISCSVSLIGAGAANIMIRFTAAVQQQLFSVSTEAFSFTFYQCMIGVFNSAPFHSFKNCFAYMCFLIGFINPCWGLCGKPSLVKVTFVR